MSASCIAASVLHVCVNRVEQNMPLFIICVSLRGIQRLFLIVSHLPLQMRTGEHTHVEHVLVQMNKQHLLYVSTIYI